MRPTSRFLAPAVLAALLVAAVSAQTPPPPPPTQGQQQGRQTQPGRGQGRGGAQGQGGQAGNQQRPNRDTQTQATGTGAISGTLVSADSGRPVKRARVNLSGDVRPARSAVTDDQGRFAFADLPAGRFTLSASKPGYVNITYGQKRPGRPGTPIQLADAQKLTNVKLPIPKGGVLTGTVLDEGGDPTAGTQVTAWRYEMRTGEKRLTQAGSDQTDDRGTYRIYGLLPGDYVVRATPRNAIGDLRQVVQDVVGQVLSGDPNGRGGGPGAGGRGGLGANLPAGAAGGLQQLLGGRGAGAALGGLLADANSGDDTGTGYAPVYYPGTTTSTNAATVTLDVSQERQGIDFQLQLVQTAKVSGTVTSPDGDASGVILNLVNETEQALGGGLNAARVQPDGTFTFNNVAPGQYVLQARDGRRRGRAGAGGGGGGRGGRGGEIVGAESAAGTPVAAPEVLWGQAQVVVDGRPVTGISVSMQPGMKVSGRVAFEGGTPPTDLTRVRVALAPMGGNGLDLGQNAPAQVDASGNFTITGVAPGRYTVRGQGQIQGYTLKSAIANGRDALDVPLEVKPSEDVSQFVLTFTDKTQELSGTLTDGSGQPATDYSVIIFSADTRFWTPQSRRIVSLRPGTDGKFITRALPPGDYLMAAVTDVEPGEWYDPEFLKLLQTSSARVTLAPGEKKMQDLKLAGGGQ
jgi:hypothetical protein